MFGSLITQPLRIATRSVQIGLRGAHEAVELAEGVVGLVASKLIGHNGHHDQAAEPAAWQGPAASSTSLPADEPAPAPMPPAPPAAEATAPPAAVAPPTAAEEPVTAEVVEESLFPETGHVSEETVLVEEVAEPGAEEGAGAELRIAEPWEGYRTMKASDIIDRIAGASPEELAAVELYELSGRNRKSVVSAAQRALKRVSPPRP